MNPSLDGRRTMVFEVLENIPVLAMERDFQISVVTFGIDHSGAKRYKAIPSNVLSCRLKFIPPRKYVKLLIILNAKLLIILSVCV